MRLVKIAPSTYETRNGELTYRIEPGHNHGNAVAGNFSVSIWRGPRRLHSCEVATRAAAVSWLEAHSTAAPRATSIQLSEYLGPDVDLSLRRRLSLRCQTERLDVVTMHFTTERLADRKARVLTAIVQPVVPA